MFLPLYAILNPQVKGDKMSLKGLTEKQINALKSDILKKSEEYTANRIKEDPEFKKSHAELMIAYEKMKNECLRRDIVPYEWNGFRVLKKNEKELIPFALKYFDELTYTHSREAFVGIFAIRGVKNLANEMLNRFRMSKHSDIRWTIGEVLYNINDKNYIDEYINIISDEEFGKDRAPIMSLIARIRVDKAIPILISISEDPSLTLMALQDLARYKSPKLLDFFRSYIESDDKEIKRVAKKAIKETEKAIEKAKNK